MAIVPVRHTSRKKAILMMKGSKVQLRGNWINSFLSWFLIVCHANFFKSSFLLRFSAPLVTRSTLEVVIPKSAVQSLLMRSGSKLAQISEVNSS